MLRLNVGAANSFVDVSIHTYSRRIVKSFYLDTDT